MILVTGGAGFVGSNFILQWMKKETTSLINLDKLTYAGNLSNLSVLENNPRHFFIKGDIADQNLLEGILKQYHPYAIIHFAAETHVDRSIANPHAFFETNVMGTQALLDAVLKYWQALPARERNHFRFLHVSTDEVYGSIALQEPPAKETAAYAPNNPYAASKASSDLMVRAYFHTFGLPILITHCSNNYGPYQFPEKLIPFMIVNAQENKPLPLYGDGLNVRNWIYVADHCHALRLILFKGRVGEIYNICSDEEYANQEVILMLCKILDELRPKDTSYTQLISYVKDRPGHDFRYAMDNTKIKKELGWRPSKLFQDHLRSTVKWYLENGAWIQKSIDSRYKEWIRVNYTERGTLS